MFIRGFGYEGTLRKIDPKIKGEYWPHFGRGYI